MPYNADFPDRYMSQAKKAFAIVVALLAGPVLIYFGAREFQNSRKLADDGKATVAKVVDHARRTGRRGRSSYYLSVAYKTASGQVLTERLKVNRTLHDRAVATGTVKLHYLPSNPAICQAGEKVETKFGTLVIGVLMLGGGVWLLLFYRQPLDQQEMAETVANQLEPLCEPQHEYARVDARQCRHLDLAFYDQSQHRLTLLGFAFLQDEENLTLRRRSIALRTFLRVLLSRDGVTMAALYHFKPSWMLRLLGAKEAKVLDLETQCSNGAFVCTSNAHAAGALNNPPEVDALFLPAGTPVEAVLEAHNQRLARFLVSHPGVQPVRQNGIEDVHRAQDLLQQIKAAHRKRTGLSKEEWQRLAGTRDAQTIDTLHAETMKLHEERIRKAA